MEAFYPGLHQPSDAQYFARCCIHVNRLTTRKKLLGCGELLMDSQAFRTLELHGDHVLTPEQYAAASECAAGLCERIAIVTQDYPCEQYMFQRRFEHTGTRHTVADHQASTIERYDAIRKALDKNIYLMPVLQGYKPHEYVDCIRQYGDRLSVTEPGMWVGVGSVCKRNGSIDKIAEVLLAIATARPDLRLHAFGLKLTALESDLIRSLLYSADSMAWSYAARKQGRNANDWHEAEDFSARIVRQKLKTHGYQHSFL